MQLNRFTKYKYVTKALFLCLLTIQIFSKCSDENNYKLEGDKPSKLSVDIIQSVKRGKPDIELRLIKEGLVDVQEIDSSISIDMKYTTTDNFVGIDLYGDLERVYIQPDVADKLKHAQSILKQRDSSLSLKIFDGVRPHFVQQLMWDSLVMPFHEKTKFLSNPKNHSIHNYGAAVDLTIIDDKRKELDMGTEYDHIGKLCYPRLEQQFLASGELTQQHINNRQLLRDVMKKAGFRYLPTEWWHFNSCSRIIAKQKYNLIK